MPKDSSHPSATRASIPQTLLKAECAAPILYIADEGFLRRERFAALYLHTFAAKRNVQREDFDGRSFSEKDLDSFFAATRTLSLFTEDKMIYFRYVDELSASLLNAVAKEFEKLSPTVHILFSGTPMPEQSIFKKQIEKFGTYLLFDELKGPELKRWIKKECAQSGITDIDEQSIELILELSQHSTARAALDYAASMIERISLFVDGGKATVGDIRALYQKSAETSEFLLADAVLTGDQRKSMTLGSRSLQAGLQPYGFVPLLGRSVSNLMAVVAANSEKFGIDRLKTALSLNPWVANKLVTVLKKADATAIGGLTTKVLTADLRLKSKSLHPADIIFDMF